MKPCIIMKNYNGPYFPQTKRSQTTNLNSLSEGFVGVSNDHFLSNNLFSIFVFLLCHQLGYKKMNRLLLCIFHMHMFMSLKYNKEISVLVQNEHHNRTMPPNLHKHNPNHTSYSGTNKFSLCQENCKSN